MYSINLGEIKMYYVYALCDPNKPYNQHSLEFSPFYIGYGKSERMYSHWKYIQKVKKLDKTNNTYKNIVLFRLKENNQHVVYVKLYDNLTVDVAKQLEIETIKLFGRKDIKTGILGNLTDGGDGISNISEETRLRMSESHKGNIPANIEEFKNWYLNFTPEELSERGRNAALSKNNGIKKPPRERMYPGLTRSEVASIRESEKTEEQQHKINQKISFSKIGKEPCNKQIVNYSLEQKFIIELFDAGLSCKNIIKFFFNEVSYSGIAGTIKEVYGQDTKLYKRQSEEEAMQIINELSTITGLVSHTVL